MQLYNRHKQYHTLSTHSIPLYVIQTRIGQMASQTPNYTVTDCRSLVKTLVSGVKTITWGTSSCKAPNIGSYEHSLLTKVLNTEQ